MLWKSYTEEEWILFLCITMERWCLSEKLRNRLTYTLPFSWNLKVRRIERTGFFTHVLQPARRMHAFWSETLYAYQCLVLVTSLVIVTSQRIVGKLGKKYVYLPKEFLFDKWKTKNRINVRTICYGKIVLTHNSENPPKVVVCNMIRNKSKFTI